MTGGAATGPYPLMLRTARLAALVSFLLALVAAVLALGVTAAGGFDCRAYPGCLLQPPGWETQAHVTAGALLGVAILVLFALGLLLRHDRPRALPYSAASLLLVILMGGIGAGLSTGALPDAFLVVQSVLVLVLLFLLYRTYRALDPRRSPIAPREGAAGDPVADGNSHAPG